MLRSALAFILMLTLYTSAYADDVILKQIPGAKVVGEGRLSIVFWDVYDATLYAPHGKLDMDKPFALSIRYMREIEGLDIAERSAEEIRGQGFSDEEKLADWNTQMKNIFPDTKHGTRLTAVFIPGKKTIFYEGDRQIGTIKDAEFTQMFSDIWLGEKTSEPGLRRKLLGLS